MRKLFFYFIPAFVLGAFVACSDDDKDYNPSPISISSNDASVVVADDGKSAEVYLAPGGSSATLSVAADGEWTMTDPADWCDISTTATGITISAEAIDSESERSTSFVVSDSHGNSATVKVTQSAVPTLEVGTLLIGIPSDGGEQMLTVTTNQASWDYEILTGGNWLEEVKLNNGLELSAGTNDSGQTRSATIAVSAGSGNDYLEVTVEVIQTTDELILLFDMGDNGRILPLPIYGVVDCTIDWGDGQTENVAKTISNRGGMVTHEYATGGEKEVKISGKVARLNNYTWGASNNYVESKWLTGVKQWGNVGLTSLQQAFHTSSIKTLPVDWNNSLSGVTLCNQIFYRCYDLEEIPEGFFHQMTENTNFQQSMQDCTSLTSIPAGLFDYNTKVTTVSFIFSGCTGITEIPEGLFDAMTEVTLASSAFRDCTALKTVPASLFDNMRKITGFANTFNGCTELESESPYTMIGDNKVHLYERSEYEEFTTPTAFGACFAGCEKMADYSEIAASHTGWL